MSFKNFLNETLAQSAMPQKDLKSSYNKDEIVSHWKSLTATSIIPITPKPRDHYGTSLDEDTIRVTGSKEFIDAVMVRLKEFLQFDTSETELDVKYQASKYEHAGGLSPNFHFYCSVKLRPKPSSGPDLFYQHFFDVLLG